MREESDLQKTRNFYEALIFWYFWIKPKVRTNYSRKIYTKQLEVGCPNAQNKSERIILVNESQNGQNEFIDDIIDEMIEINLKYGGDAVFIEGDALDIYRGLVLLTRY